MEKEVAIGIDFGTTFSCAFCVKNKQCDPIPSTQGQNIIPSAVWFNGSNICVGKAAETTSDPENVILQVKRMMGRSCAELVGNVDFKVFDQQEMGVVEVDYYNKRHIFRPEEISATILHDLKSKAESYMDAKVTECVVTVPAAFDECQRMATRNAVKIAGMRCLSIINEPTAAVLAYVYQNEIETSKPFLIFDIGGGTCDVSVGRVNNSLIEIIASEGDIHLGGDDFDKILFDYFLDELKKKGITNIIGNRIKTCKLRNICRKMKHALSYGTEITETFDFADGQVMKLTRARFEHLSKSLFERITSLLPKLEYLYEKNQPARIKNPIDNIILVGGSSRIPHIKQVLEKAFPKANIKSTVNPDEVVAKGAGIYAAKLSANMKDICENIAILDISPMSLGVETAEGRMQKIIEKNASIPAKFSKMFTTKEDNITSVCINVFQGEHEKTCDNNFLGDFMLEGIRKAAKGVVKIVVEFYLNNDFILHIKAFESSDENKKIEYTVTSFGRGLRKNDISVMQKALQERSEATKQELIRQSKKSDLYMKCEEILEKNGENDNISKRCNEILAWIEEKPNAKTGEYEKFLKDISNL